MKLLTVFLLALPLFAQPARPQTITQDELVRRTQQLYDAVAVGNQEPWKTYFADDALYSDEKGRNMDKTALVADIAPLPKGFSGNIKVVRPASRIFHDVAILSYDMDETEDVFGQHLTARYHVTDTWLLRNGKWQIVASQAFRYYEDPALGPPDPNLDRYVGTYQLGDMKMNVTREGENLFSERVGRKKEQLFPEAPTIFFRKGQEGRRLFRTGSDGKVDALIDRRNNEDMIWKKIN